MKSIPLMGFILLLFTSLALAEEQTPAQTKDSTEWSMIGSINAGLNYRYVHTRKNYGPLNEAINEDPIKVKERYPNIWEVPGFGANTSVYLLMQNNNGKSLELSLDLYSNSWNKADFNPVYLRYSDAYNTLTLGDFYFAGMSIFGAEYTLSLFKNKLDNPLLSFNTFFGEAQKPLLRGEKHPDIYKNWIKEGDALAQRLVWGGDFKWDPQERFNVNFGALFSNDEINDPLIRDGGSSTTITLDPLQSAMSLYAEVNSVLPNSMELQGQIAIGRADTADVQAQRAINAVFQEAGLSTSSLITLRKLMQNTSLIQTLSREELIEVFGDYASLTNSQMRDSLNALISAAKKTRDEFEKDIKDSRTLGLDFKTQNISIGASLFWNIGKTTLFGHANYIGENYYSPGSPNQLSNVRELGGYLKQEVSPNWTLKFNYELDVENAVESPEVNAFGLSESTKYLHQTGLENEFKINEKMKAFLNYDFEYQTQSRPYLLRSIHSAESEVYKDPWFADRGNTTTTLINYRDTTVVDLERWQRYETLAFEPFIASDFQETFFKHFLKIGASFKHWNTEYRLSGILTSRIDGSKFKNNSLIKGMDLSSETWAKMGYYFDAANYIEVKVPLTIKTKHDQYLNNLKFTPRVKNYERDKMKETELSLSDELEISLFSKFITLSLGIEMKSLKLSWNERAYALKDTLTGQKFYYYRLENNEVKVVKEPAPTDNIVDSHLQKLEKGYELVSEAKNTVERENDLILQGSIKINHSQKIYSEWICRGEFFDRPDQMSNEYKTLYVGVNFNYSF